MLVNDAGRCCRMSNQSFTMHKMTSRQNGYFLETVYLSSNMCFPLKAVLHVNTCSENDHGATSATNIIIMELAYMANEWIKIL